MASTQLKFGRSYSISIGESNGNTLTVELPFTIEFDIQRNDLASSNIASFRIYNLSAKNRNLLRKDIQDVLVFRPVTMRAGYGLNNPVIFQGYVQQAWSVREGVNFITQIECFDGGQAFTTGQTSITATSGTPTAAVIDTLINSLPGTTVGAIGSFPDTISRATPYNGSTTSILSDLTGGGFFIDNGKGYALGPNEVVPGDIQVINSASGLLGTPIRENLNVRLTMLFEPKLRIAQQVKLQSITGENFNGSYKVFSISHKGTISESVCGDAITTVGLINSNALVTVPTTQ